MKLGDSVKIKQGTNSPDYDNLDISGWQGRIIDVDEEGNLFTIEWDSKTLQDMPADYIVSSFRDGLSFELLDIEQTDVEPAEERDTIKEVRKIQEKLSLKYEMDDEDDFEDFDDGGDGD